MNQNAELPDPAKGSAQIQRQVRLPFLKSLEISIKSIKVRFFRSLITTISLVLAVPLSALSGVSLKGLVSKWMGTKELWREPPITQAARHYRAELKTSLERKPPPRQAAE